MQIDSIEVSQDLAETAFRDLLGAFPHIRFRVTGSCMAPDLGPGDAVHLVRPALKRPRFGDIVLRRQAEGLRLHRLVWNPPAVIGAPRTRADRALLWDPPLASGDVLGTVAWVEGKGRPQSVLAGCRSLIVGLLARAQTAFLPSARA